MSLRAVLPVAACAFAFATASGCSSNGSDRMAEDLPSTQVRPAQMTRCDALAQQVEHRIPTAKTFRVPAAEADLREAQELCRSGRTEEGISMLHGVLGYMDQEP